MKIHLFDDPQRVTAEALECDLKLLPLWRREQALRYRRLIDRVLCTKAYLLLMEGLREDFGIRENPTFVYGTFGKPMLDGHPEVHFNLSHCSRGVLCAIDHHPVGCDIEEIVTTSDPDMERHCFNRQEQAQIAAADSPQVEFTKLWTVKEAVLKLTGEGISDRLPSIFTPRLLKEITLDTHVDESKGYVYTTCQYRPRPNEPHRRMRRQGMHETSSTGERRMKST